jgi:hypothetical protein
MDTEDCYHPILADMHLMMDMDMLSFFQQLLDGRMILLLTPLPINWLVDCIHNMKHQNQTHRELLVRLQEANLVFIYCKHCQ